jgi:HTH-type transcriptional regulator, competence development regulator
MSKKLKRIELNVDSKWLARNASEDAGSCVSVGGLASKLGLFASRHVPQVSQTAFARLIELRRREKGLSTECLAESADIELEEIVSIEQGDDAGIEPRTVFNLATVLNLPPKKLMQLAGLTEATDEQFHKAAVRFAARSKPISALSKEEQAALSELVRAMSEEM